MERPILSIEKKPIDQMLEIIGLAGAIVLLVLPIIYYSKLPDIIPRHFSFSGEADGYGAKAIIWLLPVIGIILYMGLTILLKFPHVFNYPKEITNENAEAQYSNSIRMMRVLKTIVILLFVYIMFMTINTALGKTSGLGYGAIVFLVLIFGSLAYFIRKSLKF